MTAKSLIAPDGMSIRILRRKCVRCGNWKPNNRKFWDTSKDTPIALWRVCKRCEYIERRAEQRRQYYQQNKERIAEQRRQYRAQNKERIAEQRRQYYQQNKERITEYQRQYYQQNKERITERRRRYQARKIAKKYHGIRPVRSLSEQAAHLRAQYGSRSVSEALGI